MPGVEPNLGSPQEQGAILLSNLSTPVQSHFIPYVDWVLLVGNNGKPKKKRLKQRERLFSHVPGILEAGWFRGGLMRMLRC